MSRKALFLLLKSDIFLELAVKVFSKNKKYRLKFVSGNLKNKGKNS